MIQIDATAYRDIQASLYLVGGVCLMAGIIMHVPKDAFMPREDNDE